MVLMVNNLTGFGGGGLLTGSPDLYQILVAHGLASACKVCLDAGNSTSYTSGQTWTDLSGNSNNYFRGLTSSSEAGDPTFNGAAGSYGTTNYWSTDGGDYFWESSSQSFSDDWHKGVSSGFTAIAMVYSASGSAGNRTVWTSGNTTQRVTVQIDNGPNLELVHAITNSSVETLSTTITYPSDSWFFIAASLFPIGYILRINNQSESGVATASTATGTNTSNVIWGLDTSTNLMDSGDRLMAIALLDGPQQDTVLESIYKHIKANRITSLP